MDEIKSAYEHIVQKLSLDQIKPSLNIDFEKATKVYDLTHKLMYIGGNVVSELKDYSFKTNSLYFIHNWEIFDQATRSNVEALSTYYNSAFVLLRTIIELLIKECSMIVLHTRNSEMYSYQENARQRFKRES